MSARKFLILAVLAFLILPSRFVYSQSNQTESLTITTYYPAPYGVYRNLKLNPSVEPTVGVSEGVMYYNQTEHKLKIWSCLDQPGCTAPLGWLNITDSSNSGLPLVNSVHTEGDCLAAGGTLVPSATGLKQCKLPAVGNNCPPGWNQYSSFLVNTAVTKSCNAIGRANGSCFCSGGGCGCTATVNIPATSWGNNPKTYMGSCSCLVCGSCDCSVAVDTITEIGCF